MILYILIF